ncbi:MAG: hypothetical protein ABI432_11300 [Flavobacteriales bacterium]
MRPNLRPFVLAVALLGAAPVLHADAGATNVDCQNALSFCEDLHFPFDQGHFDGCLWFSFTVPPGTDVTLTASSLGGKFRLVGPQDPAAPCLGIPVSACAGQFQDQIVVHIPPQLGVQPSVYFITVTYSSGQGQDVDIDVLSGLACEAGIPTNIDCDTAIPFCDDLIFAYDEVWADSNQGCLWFSFTLSELTDVEIDITSTGSKIYIYPPLDPEERCPPCGSEGALLSGQNMVHLEDELGAGVYYVAVSVSNGAQSPIDIDVIEGLACDPVGGGGDPTNVDCDSAIPLCSDLIFPYDEDWAAHYQNCLWFSFTLPEATDVDMTITSAGSKIYLHPDSPGERCPPCGSEGAIVYGQNTLHIHQQLPPGLYYVGVMVDVGTESPIQIDIVGGVECLPCDDCIPPFELEEGQSYILSTWVHVPGLPGTTLTFTTPKVIIESPPGTFLTSFIPEGPIIDGWQRMEDEFTTPPGYSGLKVLLTVSSDAAYYDDVRLFPKDGSMKCYVYDPVDLRFVAELDERHYATFYEYDSEGKLARVKKETERGIMTIQESRNNSSKLSGQ